MNAKEKWINEVESSLNGLKQPEVNPYIYSKILNRINSAETDYTPKKLVWIAASSLIILIFLNIIILSATKTVTADNTQDLEIVAKQFQLINDNSITYN